jgi:hypothetical protein
MYTEKGGSVAHGINEVDFHHHGNSGKREEKGVML